MAWDWEGVKHRAKQGGMFLAGAPGAALSMGDREKAIEKQTDAAEKAQAQKLADIQQARTEMKAASGLAQREISFGAKDQRNILREYGGSALQHLGEGYDAAGSALQGGYEQGYSTLGQARGQSLGALDRGYSAASMALGGAQAGSLGAMGAARTGSFGALSEGYSGARGAYGQLAGMGPAGVYQTQAPGMTQGMYQQGIGQSRAEQVYGQPMDITQDPGYQYRLQEGEKAINRAAAARGGRGGGQTMLELQRHGQGMASQEYGAAFNRQMTQAQAADQQELMRRQQQMGLATTADRFGLQQQMDLAGRTDKSSWLAQKLRAEGISSMGDASMKYGDSMANMYGKYGSMESDIYNKYGTQQADLYSQHGVQQADMYGAYGMAEADYNITQGQQIGALAGQKGEAMYNHYVGLGDKLGNVYGQEASALADLHMQGAGAGADITMQGLSTHDDMTQYAGAQDAFSGHNWEFMNPQIDKAAAVWSMFRGGGGGGGGKTTNPSSPTGYQFGGQGPNAW